MFGAKQIHINVKGGSHSHSHRHEVTEKKAPTDESMRLLEEFKTKAEKSVISRGILKCSNTDIEIAWIKQAFTMENPFNETISYRLKINKKTIEGKISLEPEATEIEIADQLIEAVASRLVADMVMRTMREEAIKGNTRPFTGKYQ